MYYSAELRLWLATPDAAQQLDVAALGAADAASWGQIVSEGRRRDWASSRALIMAHPEQCLSHCSLSHSRGYAALARAEPTFRVGVDVEIVRPREFLRLSEFAFCADESEYLRKLPAPLLECRFYEFWTIKEAFAKALDLPLLVALQQCRCIDPAGQRVLLIPTEQRWRVIVFAPRPELRLAIACISPSTSPSPALTAVTTAEWPTPARAAWPIVFEAVHPDGLADHRVGDD